MEINQANFKNLFLDFIEFKDSNEDFKKFLNEQKEYSDSEDVINLCRSFLETKRNERNLTEIELNSLLICSLLYLIEENEIEIKFRPKN